MIKDNIKTTGWVKVKHFDANMRLIEEREFKNLVVTTGKNFITSRMNGAGLTPMSHIAIGSLNTAAAVGDTALGSELARVACSAISVVDNSITFTADYPPGVGTGSIVEAGIFNAASAGVMLGRTVFAALNKAAGDSVIISWTVTNS